MPSLSPGPGVAEMAQQQNMHGSASELSVIACHTRRLHAKPMEWADTGTYGVTPGGVTAQC